MATECLWPCVLYQWHWLLLFSVRSSLDIRVSTVISSLFPPSPPRCNLLAWVLGSQTMFCAKITVRCRGGSGGPLSWLPQTAHGFLLSPQAALPAALVSLWVTVYSGIAIKIIPLFSLLTPPRHEPALLFRIFVILIGFSKSWRLLFKTLNLILCFISQYQAFDQVVNFLCMLK